MDGHGQEYCGDQDLFEALGATQLATCYQKIELKTNMVSFISGA